MEWDKICQNCGFFIQASEDFSVGLGICSNDVEFEPFIEPIIENADFSKCYDLYLKKRYEGERKACEEYEEPEIVEMSGDMDIDTYILLESLKYQNIDEIIKLLYDNDKTTVNKAISMISRYFYIGNESAYKGLNDYYMSLGSAENLEDVYSRMKIIDMLSIKESKQETIDAYINELARTPSNNTTRQLYSKILERLARCPLEMVQEPLLDLLDKKKYGVKMKNKIMDVAIREADEYW